MQRQKWTEQEIEILKQHYGTMPRKELQKQYLPNRSIPTIAQKAKSLNLTYVFQPWSDDENKILMENWTIMPKKRLLNMLSGRTWTQCRNQVNKLKQAGKWIPQERRNYAAIEPEEQKRRSEFYNQSLRYKMGLGFGTSVKSFQNNRIASNNKTGVRGVSKTKNGKFVAYIRFQGKLKYLGTFSDLEDAKNAREDAMKDLQSDIDEIAAKLLQEEATSKLVARGVPDKSEN